MRNPDGYTVNGDGAWTESGMVQSRAANTQETAQNPEGAVQMRITVGDQVLTAALEDNATARAITERLPMTLPMMDIYGCEMCCRFDEELPANEARVTGFEVGDIIYWRSHRSFVILYHQDGARFEMQKAGYINADSAVIEELFGHGDVNVTYELID